MEAAGIVCTATGKQYKICRDFTCDSKYIVYCTICNRCLQEIVGSTDHLKQRCAIYKSHITFHPETSGISKYFIHECHDDKDSTGLLVFVIMDGLNNISGLSKRGMNYFYKKKNSALGHVHYAQGYEQHT